MEVSKQRFKEIMEKPLKKMFLLVKVSDLSNNPSMNAAVVNTQIFSNYPQYLVGRNRLWKGYFRAFSRILVVFIVARVLRFSESSYEF